jgi:hypothetical protein
MFELILYFIREQYVGYGERGFNEIEACFIIVCDAADGEMMYGKTWAKS